MKKRGDLEIKERRVLLYITANNAPKQLFKIMHTGMGENYSVLPHKIKGGMKGLLWGKAGENRDR